MACSGSAEPHAALELSASRQPQGSKGSDGADASASSEAPLGLAPAQARPWLALQARSAFVPEQVAPLLRAGWTPEAILPLAGASPTDSADAVARLEGLRARVVPFPDAAYPAALRVLEDAPILLIVRGRVERLATPAVAIVGARAATRAARTFARRLAFDLARVGVTIVSGLARGIDAEAHRGALEAGGATIGVLACGIDRIYPPEHRGLAEQMQERGAIVSELPLGALPRPAHFPLRNRIISGLARAVVVVEARERSGSLITVRHALDQGREVFVVPGPVDGPFAAGTNQLLREGARAIRSARDLLDDLGLDPGPVDGVPGGGPSGCGGAACASDPLAARLLARLAEGPCSRDELLLEAALDPGRLATALVELELAGEIAEERDGLVHRCGRPPGSGLPGGRAERAP